MGPWIFWYDLEKKPYGPMDYAWIHVHRQNKANLDGKNDMLLRGEIITGHVDDISKHAKSARVQLYYKSNRESAKILMTR